MNPTNKSFHHFSRRSILPETKKWDVFRVLPPDAGSGSEANQRCLEITVKIVKVVVLVITFGVVLTCGVIAKGTTLFMTSQLKKNKVVEYCNRNIGEYPSGARVCCVQRYRLRSPSTVGTKHG